MKAKFMLIAALLLTTVGLLPKFSLAVEEYSQPAAGGYDVVAQFKHKIVRGDGLKASNYEGKTYLFSSDENKVAFEKDPAHYAPQYGGWCAFGASVNKKFHGDPTVYAVVNDKLYYNVNPAIALKWNLDQKGNIAKADANWPKIQDKDPASL